MSSKRFGYIRVSTVAQSLDRQTDALVAAGIDPDDIYSDKITGKAQHRPGLSELLRHVRDGDEVLVVSLDRLGRTALHVLQTIAELEERGIRVQSLKDGENLSGPTGKLMRGLMALVAEWEVSMNTERVAEARAARAARAKAGEQVAGRPRTAMTPERIAKVRELKANGYNAKDIGEFVGISRSSVYRLLSED